MTPCNLPKLGIIAGSGHLPREIIKACQVQCRPFFVLAYEGQTDLETYQNQPHFQAHLGKVGEAIHRLKDMNVKELVLAGRFRRPSWFELKPDALAAKWLAKSAKNIFGDDSLLQVIVKNLEQEGFVIRSAEEIVGQKLLAPAGILGKHQPDERDLLDIAQGVKVAKGLGVYDIGQSVILQGGLVLGVEAIEGTDQLIMRCKMLKRSGGGGVLIKIVKPHQDTRMDRPTVGLDTVRHMVDAGLKGIAIEAHGVIVHQLSDMVEMADQEGIFLIGIHPL